MRRHNLLAGITPSGGTGGVRSWGCRRGNPLVLLLGHCSVLDEATAVGAVEGCLWTASFSLLELSSLLELEYAAGVCTLPATGGLCGL